jgi:hypothetical protein
MASKYGHMHFFNLKSFYDLSSTVQGTRHYDYEYGFTWYDATSRLETRKSNIMAHMGTHDTHRQPLSFALTGRTRISDLKLYIVWAVALFPVILNL